MMFGSLCMFFAVFKMPPKHHFGIEITPLSFIPGARIEQYLGHLNFFIIRETTSIREVWQKPSSIAELLFPLLKIKILL